MQSTITTQSEQRTTSSKKQQQQQEPASSPNELLEREAGGKKRKKNNNSTQQTTHNFLLAHTNTHAQRERPCVGGKTTKNNVLRRRVWEPKNATKSERESIRGGGAGAGAAAAFLDFLIWISGYKYYPRVK